ncbi:MAG: RNA-binding protein [Candidatus Fischerbacteria bacterium RBG_13_37_8]|uniref:RNA-binding protein n=1 Tax=Candidatus Fischerbacteria bacterium RBG_13_37_8 TaxID=1817863 RepID=A0A1F5VLC4_9BACT|nr:MAG: RNA-binding protein [Candidatus Fischerbacteria bacterium RBG_13_37_8]
MNIYVGNLAREVTEADLRAEFEAFGQVATVTIIKDKLTGESRGFGFVEMQDTSEAQAAMNALNGKEVKGRVLNVNEARPRTNDRRRPSGGGRNDSRGGDRGRRGPGRSGGGGRGRF